MFLEALIKGVGSWVGVPFQHLIMGVLELDAKVNWGVVYGAKTGFNLPDGRRVAMYRKGQKVRWYDISTGEQVGPE